MRTARSTSATATATLLVWLVPLVSGISVPTGKLTPITPARPTPRSVNPHAPAQPAPVSEYTQDNPEPPPLDPSYVPVTYNYFDTLAKHHVFYFPVRYRNFNALPAPASNSIDYEPPQKFLGQTLGKNIAYKPYKHQLSLPYYPTRTAGWESQYNNVYSNQYDNNNYNNNNNNQYSQYNSQANSQSIQYNAQPTQQQQYEAVSTAAPTGSPQPTAQETQRTGKGSYDVTGKGGGKSEFFSKQDWSKKSFPKKVLSHQQGAGKYGSYKY